VTLDEKNRIAAAGSQPTDLPPEAAVAERHEEIECCLSLDHRRFADGVVPAVQSADLHRCSEFNQETRDAAPGLESIGDDLGT
jgi:hypothetical protein